MKKVVCVTTALQIALLSQILWIDFLARSSIVFIAGFVSPAATATTRTIVFSSIDKRHHQTQWKVRHHLLSIPSQPLWLSREPSRLLKSMCLFDSKSFQEDQITSTATMFGAPKTEDTKSLSPSVGDNSNVSKKIDRGLFMNPMENFAVEKAIETMDIDGGNKSKSGLLTIGFITLLFATNSPVLHWAFTTGNNSPPVLLVNTGVSVVALVGLLLGGDALEDNGTLPSNAYKASRSNSSTSWMGGVELGMWKFLGTTSNLYGLALTTSSHAALLIQLTTLIVPTTRAVVYKESISNKLKTSIALAFLGVVCFANDPTGTPSPQGDGLCVVAAICYSAYDLRLYEYGKIVDVVKPLITTKIATQALFSIGLLFLGPSSLLYEGTTATVTVSPWQESCEYLQALSRSSELVPVVAAVTWSGVAVNAIAPFLQVRGQQIVGPTKCQTIYASQPLWAAIMSFAFLKERLGLSGVIGGTTFLVALVLAASEESSTTTTPATNAESGAIAQMVEPEQSASTKDIS